MITRLKYNRCSKRAAMLFQLTRDLKHVNPNYHFSLQWFMKLFKHEVDAKVEINPAIDPLAEFNTRFTRYFHLKISIALESKDKLMLSFIIAM